MSGRITRVPGGSGRDYRSANRGRDDGPSRDPVPNRDVPSRDSGDGGRDRGRGRDTWRDAGRGRDERRDRPVQPPRARPRPVLEAAAIGHRITHEDDLPEPLELLVTATEWAVGQHGDHYGEGGLVAGLLSRAISSIGEMITGDDDEDRECPDPCGEIEVGSIDTFIGPDKMGAALVDEEAEVPCEDHSDGPIVMGAAHVWVNNLRWARRTDELDCGALVGEGLPTVLIGAAAEKAERREPVDSGSWMEQTVMGALASSGRFGRLEASFGAQLGAVCAGARRMSAAELKAQLDGALSGAAGAELARRIAAGDPWAVREALIR